jgi:hypothetical protein
MSDLACYTRTLSKPCPDLAQTSNTQAACIPDALPAAGEKRQITEWRSCDDGVGFK